MEELYDLFEDFDTNIICVEDFNIVVNHCLITHLVKCGRKVQIWCGDPTKDKDATELILTYYQRKKIFDEVVDLMS